GSPLHPAKLDILEGDKVLWQESGTHYQAFIDEIVINHVVLRAAFRDAEQIEPEW
ncbi:MAG: hypothetical protein JOZ51_18240, partial [Chloroflexi bacterium]|nr:hypothetical protein [Chloroflexota bacterium]